jgi:hypothetical protein
MKNQLTGLGKCVCVGFYAISYVWVCEVVVAKMPAARDPTSCTRVKVQDAGQTGTCCAHGNNLYGYGG